MELGGFEGSQFTVEDLELVDKSSLEAVVAHALTEGDKRIPAAGDFAGELVADDFGIKPFAVEVELESCSPAGAVVGHRDMVPFSDGENLLAADAQGVAWVEVDEGGAEFAVLKQKLVAAAGGIGPGFGATDDDGSLEKLRSVHPEPDRERLGAVEVANIFESHRIVTGESETLSVDALH